MSCNSVFVFKRNGTARDFCDMKETLRDSASVYSTVRKWHAEFKQGRSSCDDLHQCERPATSVNEEIVEKVNKLVMYDRQQSVC